MAFAYAIRRTVSSNSTLLIKACSITNKCSFSFCNVLSKKLSIAEELDLPEPPSKPHQPFVKFMSMGHKQLINLTWAERVQKLSVAWHNQTQEEKTRRLNEYYEEKKEYQLKYREYLNQLSHEQLESIRHVQERRKQFKDTALAKKEKKKELERLGKPKIPENCFLVFAHDLERPDNMSWMNFLVHAASKWKALPEGERKLYKDSGRARMEKYEAEMVEWENKMLAAGRIELVRRRTYQIYRSFGSDEQLQVTSVPTDSAASTKQTITTATSESEDSGEESNRERKQKRASHLITITGEDSSPRLPSTTILKRRTTVAETRDRGDNESHQRMVCEEFFPRAQANHLTNESALLRRPYSVARRETVVSPQGYASLATRRPTQQRNAMFAATFPED